ncbi:MAG: 5'-nucleotidase C-terminal domain-containing protein [Eubacteriales bacterium]|nr:5'-nucleotidase C-terminal domain-containing protein [Eubacteriales bacterium]MDD6017487.1 5'-nucleotidase C-terminal domain-containing protein [Clostridiales bacterium]MDY2596937.1 5'-nucleotidase C-terminal domain-containing protein [Eubacteriales bacterium]MDY3309182.1 5'-nucleotidase C-terminal domain-containing protein [Eubacteriales bacterium]
MKKGFKLLSVAIVFALVLSMMSGVFAAVTLPGEDDDLSGQLVILHTNDSHGRIKEDGTSMGMSAVKYLANRYENAGASVLILDAGDTLHGLPIVTASRGESAVNVMNAVGYSAMAPGNHDFNYGYEHILELEEEMNFPVLAANVTYEADGSLVFGDHIVITCGEYTIGVFGMATPETVTKTNPNNVVGLDFNEDNLAGIAQAQCDELKELGCDIIICLAHLGDDVSSTPYRSTDVLEQVTDIDLWIDGHSHSVLNDDGEAHLVNGTLVASTGEYTKNIGVVTYDGAEFDAGLVHYADLCNTYEQDGEIITEFYGYDPEITALVQNYYDEMMEFYSEVVGHTDVLLNGTREFVRTQETNLGDLAADAILAAAPNADFALTNGGGIRANIEIGDITRYDLFTVFPFGNMVATVELTGAQIVYILEAATHACPGIDGAFPQVSGITFEIHTYIEYEGEYANPTNPGSRIQNVCINGEPIDLDATYVMATNDFLAAGGDTYAILAENFENSGILIGINLEDALINYIQNIDDNCAGYAEPAGRIVIVDEAPVEPTPAPAPGTGAADIIGFGIVAIICGGFVVFFRRKSYINK